MEKKKLLKENTRVILKHGVRDPIDSDTTFSIGVVPGEGLAIVLEK